MGRVWANRSYRLIAWAWLAIVVGLGLALVFSPGMPWWGAILVGVVFGALGAAGWAVYGVTNVSLRGEWIIVRNPFRLIEVPVGAVRAIEAGQHLSLHLRNGRVVRAWSVQAANASLLLNRHSHVDDVAAELRDAVAAAGHSASPAEIVERPPTSRPFAIVVALAAVVAGLLRLIVH
ncbi:MAG: hypothetical protein ACRD0M_10060 [Acidimicrobiales bacterium]